MHIKRFFILFIFISASIISTAQEKLIYTNPILAGFYPDPSIVRAGDDYYLTTSTFAYFPGLPIFHSKDLVNWQLVGHAMDRNEQLDLKGAGVSRGLFAPAIKFHKGVFYITCTLVDKGGNFIITATDPRGPWSNPVWLPKISGIDPSLYFDEDGKMYIIYNSEPPNNKTLYDGHRTIRMWELNSQTFEATGEEILVINGGTDISKKPVWIEAPHIINKDGWYYLICAEGGTAYNHSEVVFRSKQATGPYVSYENNPILTQRHLDRKRPFPVTTTGHADFVQAPNGDWYAVFLGCRPYEGEFFNIGRETFMTPVEWKDGWPLINPGFETVQYRYPVPSPGITQTVNNPFSGNYSFEHDFKRDGFNQRFIFLRNPTEGLYTTGKKGLSLPLKPVTVSGNKNPAFAGFRQAHHQGYAQTLMDFKPENENEKAGLLIFQNEQHYYFLARTIKNGKPFIELIQSAGKEGSGETVIASQELRSFKKPLQLKIEANGNSYAFYFAEKNKPYQLLKDNVDARFLSTATAGGFVGSLFALYGTSNGQSTRNAAHFRWFKYKGDDEVYRKVD